METIFFERQEGMLCAQHALNMLLQQPYFTAVDLAEIARELDERERAVMSPSALANFKSINYDDTGYFSIQVITEALKNFGLRVIPIDNPDYAQYRINPEIGNAYICNFRVHWFVVRKFGNQWFHMNSMRTGPELISEHSLRPFFDQIIYQGYSVFIVEGNLPDCLANNVIQRNPIPAGVLGMPTLTSPDEDDEELAMAISLSEAEHKRAMEGKPAGNSPMETEDTLLQKALQESMNSSLFTVDDINRAIQESLSQMPSSSTASASHRIPKLTSSYSIEERRNAIEPVQAETLRQKRSRFLDQLESQDNKTQEPNS